MSKTLTVEGTITAVDTVARLTSQGSVTAPSLVTPAGVKMIKKIISAVTADCLAAGQVSYILRLGGSAVQNGEQTIVIGAAGNIAVQAGSDKAPAWTFPKTIDNVDIAVAGSDTIAVSAEMAGVDIGTSEVAVTLVFE